MERVLITGVTGFIGAEIAKKICDNYEVTGLVRTSSNIHSLDPIKDILGKMEIRYGNLTDYAGIRRLIKDINPNYVIHVGANTPVRHSFEEPMEFQEVNYNATVNMIHALLELHSFKKFIFASTMETYGWQEKKEPFMEDTKLNPASPYAVSKVACEHYIRTAHKAYGLPYMISRCCNTFGRKTQTGFVVEYIITKMLNNQDVYLGTPNAVRDLMFVDDHVNAYEMLLQSDLKNETFNFGTSNQMKMIDVANRIKELIGSESKIIEGFPPGYPKRHIVEDYLSLDATKAKTMLGWEPKVNLDEGLKRIIAYWKNKI